MKLLTVAHASTLKPYSVAVHFMKLLMDYTDKQGISTAQLLLESQINPQILNDPNDRVCYADFDRACQIAATQLNDPALGLKLGHSIRPGHLGSHGFAMMSCATADELMRQSARYSALTMDVGYNEFEIRGEECIRHWRSNLPEGLRLHALQEDLNQATSVTLVRWFSHREDLNPNWVSFCHEPPENIQYYQSLFRCPLHFNATETAIGFPAAYLKLAMPHADSQVNHIMQDLCAQLVKKLGDALEPAWLAIARKTILESFQQGIPDLRSVLIATGLTEVQLKEGLQQRGLSFRGFVDDLRHAMAMGYIHDPQMQLIDIAYLLGFSEQSAFQRAFKRWTGYTPGEYRQQSH